MMFDWKPEYSVGFAEIDALHQQVFHSAGELHAAIDAGRPPEALRELLGQVLSSIRTHFEAEEALMRSSKYPETARHKAKHEAMEGILQSWERGAVPDIEMADTLRGALIHHIEDEDRELGRRLEGRG